MLCNSQSSSRILLALRAAECAGHVANVTGKEFLRRRRRKRNQLSLDLVSARFDRRSSPIPLSPPPFFSLISTENRRFVRCSLMERNVCWSFFRERRQVTKDPLPGHLNLVFNFRFGKASERLVNSFVFSPPGFELILSLNW